MTQVIACSTPEGIALATDSLATWFDQTGTRKHFNLKKILRLGSHSALVSAGIGIGVEMGLSFQRFLKDRGAEGIEEIVRLAMPFFNELYGNYLREKKMAPFFERRKDEDPDERSPLNGVYLLLAGYSFRDRGQPYHLHLLGSDEEGISIRIYPIAHTVLIPRSLSMERRLEDERRRGSPLFHLLELCQTFLKKRSGEEDEVGPPFYFATITAAGVQEVMREGGER
jgi:hypothetical protein